MTHIHVATNIILSVTVGKHISLAEKDDNEECSDSD